MTHIGPFMSFLSCFGPSHTKCPLCPQQVIRVYIGSFWSHPLLIPDNRKLFEAEEQDLFKDIQSLPRNAALRKLNDLIKRARLAKVRNRHAHHTDENLTVAQLQLQELKVILRPGMSCSDGQSITPSPLHPVQLLALTEKACCCLRTNRTRQMAFLSSCANDFLFPLWTGSQV